ncbi:MAG: hypothetical protein R2853_20345 [Thermomicrobiales bacterium]
MRWRWLASSAQTRAKTKKRKKGKGKKGGEGAAGRRLLNGEVAAEAPAVMAMAAVAELAAVTGWRPGPAPPKLKKKLLGLVNDFRAQSGQPALGRGDKQDTAGSNHSREMANREFFSHTTPVGGTPDQRMAVAGDSYRWWGKYIG